MSIALVGVWAHGCFHTGLFDLVWNSPVKFAYFPSLVLCSHCVIVKLAKGEAVRRLHVKARDEVSTLTSSPLTGSKYHGCLFWLPGLYLFIQQTSCSGVQTKRSWNHQIELVLFTSVEPLHLCIGTSPGVKRPQGYNLLQSQRFYSCQSVSKQR